MLSERRVCCFLMLLKMFLLAVCCVLPGVFHTTAGTGKIETHFLYYSDNCDEDLGTNLCDPMFSFCLSTPQTGGSLSVDNCNYASTGQSPDHFHNTNNIDLEHLNSIVGLRNPWIVAVHRFIEPGVMLVIKVTDADVFEDDHLQTWGKVLYEKVWPSVDQAVWAQHTMAQNGHQMRFKIRMYCDPFYHSPKCDTYCKPRDDGLGHYNCETGTGNKICLEGWQGADCTQDVDECYLNPCFTGVCTNLPGSYVCQCPANFTGKHCDVGLQPPPCASNPCQNGGTCLNLYSDNLFICSCPEEWEGDLCQMNRDHCHSQPCLNNGSCNISIDGTTYNCTCVYPFTGDSCESLQTTLSSTTDTTVTTTETLTESSSTAETSSTTDNSSSTEPKSFTKHDKINSTPTAAELPIEKFEKATDQKRGDDFQLWYIAIIIAVTLIVTGIIIGLFIRRRRMKASHISPPSSPAVSYNGTDLAFDNGMYTSVNRNNSENERQVRQLPPVPSQPTTPTEDELFNPAKPSYVEVDEVGATGGPGDHSATDLKKSDRSGKAASTLHVRPVSERAQSNAYADFKSLRDLQKETGNVNEESHYHDLQDVVASMQETTEAVEANTDHNASLSFDIQDTPVVAVPPSPYDFPSNNASYYATPPVRSTRPSPLYPASANLNDDSSDDDVCLQEDLAKLRQDVKNCTP